MSIPISQFILKTKPNFNWLDPYPKLDPNSNPNFNPALILTLP